MSTEAIYILAALWSVVGTIGFIMDWTRYEDLTLGMLVACIALGCMAGPFSWVIWLIGVQSTRSPIIIMRRRRSRF